MKNETNSGSESLYATLRVVDKLRSKLRKIKKDSNKKVISEENILNNLKNIYKNGDLVIVLGAGVSKDYGMPDWNDLIRELLVRVLINNDSCHKNKAENLSKLFLKRFNNSPLVIVRILEEYFNKNGDNNFNEIIREILYKDYKDGYSTEIFRRIADLCLDNNLDSIITYNYDDNIEQVLDKKKIEYESIYEKEQNPDSEKMSIYHVHGYLPKDNNLGGEHLVLSETAYHEQYSNVYNWNNITQINKFKNKTCLFIGVSLTDPNLRRLLDITNYHIEENKYHYIIDKKLTQNEIGQDQIDSLPEIKNIYDSTNSSKDDFKNRIKDLFILKNTMDTIAYTSLNIQPYWVENYNRDITNLLKKIKN